MKQRWNQDELRAMFTLTPSEHQSVTGLMDHSSIGFAVLLKLFQLNKRFPQGPGEVPREIVRFIAKQLIIQDIR